MATSEADGEISADYNDADIMFAQMMIPPSPEGRGDECDAPGQGGYPRLGCGAHGEFLRST